MSGSSTNDLTNNIDISKSIPTAGAFQGMQGAEAPSSNATSGSSGLQETLNNPMFMKYLSDMGAGMMNKPTLGQSLAAGTSAASAGMSEQMKKKQESEAQKKLNEQQMQMVMQLFKQYGGK